VLIPKSHFALFSRLCLRSGYPLGFVAPFAEICFVLEFLRLFGFSRCCQKNVGDIEKGVKRRCWSVLLAIGGSSVVV